MIVSGKNEVRPLARRIQSRTLWIMSFWLQGEGHRFLRTFASLLASNWKIVSRMSTKNSHYLNFHLSPSGGLLCWWPFCGLSHQHICGGHRWWREFSTRAQSFANDINIPSLYYTCWISAPLSPTSDQSEATYKLSHLRTTPNIQSCYCFCFFFKCFTQICLQKLIDLLVTRN